MRREPVIVIGRWYYVHKRKKAHEKRRKHFARLYDDGKVRLVRDDWDCLVYEGRSQAFFQPSKEFACLS